MRQILQKNYTEWLAFNALRCLLQSKDVLERFTMRDPKLKSLEDFGKCVLRKIEALDDQTNQAQIAEIHKASFKQSLEIVDSLSDNLKKELTEYLNAYGVAPPSLSQEIGVVHSAEELEEIFLSRQKVFNGVIKLQVFEMHDYREDGTIKEAKWLYVIK